MIYSKYKFVTQIAALLLTARLAFTQDSIEVKAGQSIESYTIPSKGSFAYFKMPVSDAYQPGQDLIIKVSPLDFESDPDIYISKTTMKPNSSLDSDWQCAAYGKDTCTIHHKNITQSDTFYIGVTCPQDACKFQLVSLFVSELQLEDGVEFQLNLYAQEVRVFKFRIPEQQEGQNQSITIKASAYRGNSRDFTLSARINQNDSGDLPATNFDSKMGIAAWKKGQVIRLTNKDFAGLENKWCSGCVLDILLDVVDGGSYHISVQTNEAAPLLQNGVQIDDIVTYRETQCYKYYVKEEDTDLQVQIATYSGQVDLQAHPLTLPDNWDDFLIKRENVHDQILDIRANFRKRQAGASKGLYFICVKGDLTSSYTLKIREFVQDMKHITLEDGYTESFFMRQDGMIVYLYQVPKLEYTGEDIEIEASIVVRHGGRPTVAGKACTTADQEQCRAGVTQEAVTGDSNEFTKGKDNGQVIKVTIDHNETYCQSALNGDCYYAIAVVNTGGSRISFVITISHTQKNHILLQEGQPHIDSVEMKAYKFYKFTLLDDTGVTNVTFQVSPIHGDSDLYASRNLSFPNKTDHEQQSMRIGSFADHVTYSRKFNETLATTYYVAVFGYTYATYSLIVQVKRSSLTSEEALKQATTHLYENIVHSISLHNEWDSWTGYFEVSVPDQDNSAIEVRVSNTQGKSKTFLRYGTIPTGTDYDVMFYDGAFRINPSDSFYHKNGTYYVHTVPSFGFLDLFIDNYYQSRIHWRYETTSLQLNSLDQLAVTTQPNSYSYITHYIVDAESDIKISLIGGGSQDIFVSFKANNSRPNKDNFDFSSKYLTGGNFANGKSIFLPAKLIQTVNPSCKDLGYAEEDPCVLYISILCNQESECGSKISLEYDNETPKHLIAGSPIHNTMNTDSYSYYYVTVPKNQLSDVFAVVTPLAGDVHLYASFQRDHKDIGQWDLPTKDSYDIQSTDTLKTEMIHINAVDMNSCFFENSTSTEECIVIFGLYAASNQSVSQVYFNFVVYKNAIELADNTPVTGYVQQGRFNYFIYNFMCSNCTLVVSLSSTSTGNADVYITKGDRLPTLDDYDVSQASLASEVVMINLDSEFAKSQKLTSIAGYYVIGVFGKLNTTFQLTAATEKQAIASLTEGLSVKHTLPPYDIAIYQFYNWVQKDVEISLSLSTGNVGLHVGTFKKNESNQNFLNQLPVNSANSYWNIQEINSVSQIEGKEIVILQEDRNYCYDCIYIISVVSYAQKSKFSITAHTIEAEKTYSHLIRVGEVTTFTIRGKNTQQIYQFMLDTKEEAKIIPTILSGHIQISVGFEESKSDSFISQSSGGTIKIKDENLKTQTNYYVIVECLSELCQLSLMIHQQSTVITLQDGIPQTLHYSDYQDSGKLMIFDLPRGDNAIQVSVKSKTKNFFPALYSTLYTSSSNSFIFPPSSLVNNSALGQPAWDEELYMLKATQEFTQLNNSAFLALNLVYNLKLANSTAARQQLDTSAEVTITMSYSRVMKLVPGQEFFGELKKGSLQFAMFKVEQQQDKNVVIEFSECIGQTSFSVLKNPNDLSNKVPLDNFSQLHGKDVAIIHNQVGDFFILVDSYDTGSADQMKEYLIKIDYHSSTDIKSTSTYILEQDGHIATTPVKHTKGDVKLTWGPVFGFNSGQAKQLTNVRYQVVFTIDPQARLSSACAAKRGIDVIKTQATLIDQTEYVVSAPKHGEELYVNVIAINDDEQITMPYVPVSIYIPKRDKFGQRWLILLIGIVLVIFGSLGIFYYCKTRSLRQRVENEIKEVYGPDSTVSIYKKVGGSRSKYSNFTEEEKDKEEESTNSKI